MSHLLSPTLNLKQTQIKKIKISLNFNSRDLNLGLLEAFGKNNSEDFDGALPCLQWDAMTDVSLHPGPAAAVSCFPPPRTTQCASGIAFRLPFLRYSLIRTTAVSFLCVYSGTVSSLQPGLNRGSSIQVLFLGYGD